VVYIFTPPSTAAQLFEFLGVADVLKINSVTPVLGELVSIYGPAGPGDKNMANIAYVDEDVIYRFDTEFVEKTRFIITDHGHTKELGAVKIRLEQAETVRFVNRINELP